MLTMEVTLSTAFGRAVDVQGGKGGKLYEVAANTFSDFSPDSQKNQMTLAKMIQFLMRKSIFKSPCLFMYLYGSVGFVQMAIVLRLDVLT